MAARTFVLFTGEKVVTTKLFCPLKQVCKCKLPTPWYIMPCIMFYFHMFLHSLYIYSTYSSHSYDKLHIMGVVGCSLSSLKILGHVVGAEDCNAIL